MTKTKIRIETSYKCTDCGFTSSDKWLADGHSCDVELNGGYCEDWPACGHEAGDCNGEKYGSDESIKEQVADQWRTGHGYCDHTEGIYNCEDYDNDDDWDER